MIWWFLIWRSKSFFTITAVRFGLLANDFEPMWNAVRSIIAKSLNPIDSKLVNCAKSKVDALDEQFQGIFCATDLFINIRQNIDGFHMYPKWTPSAIWLAELTKCSKVWASERQTGKAKSAPISSLQKVSAGQHMSTTSRYGMTWRFEKGTRQPCLQEKEQAFDSYSYRSINLTCICCNL